MIYYNADDDRNTTEIVLCILLLTAEFIMLLIMWNTDRKQDAFVRDDSDGSWTNLEAFDEKLHTALSDPHHRSFSWVIKSGNKPFVQTVNSNLQLHPQTQKPCIHHCVPDRSHLFCDGGGFTLCKGFQ
jgi:hypothetical protein